ncbi:hypothetical protein CHS0354_033822 [Potamilus streckersoni]|uniref:Uncharacterized protein n=1 Tax=Potamilus streckersoni TaxID=2493646 RepID=A0AAE0T8V1_9BIVA|nr:hypothetical protein CHS0354_033822 [Potamilus streckersoni]
MAASSFPPIVTPKNYDANFKVDVRLHEPLFPPVLTASDTEIEILTLCSQLDTLCRKELKEQNVGNLHQGKFTNSFTNRARIVYDRIQQTLAKNPSANHDCLWYLQEKGINKLYPRAVAYLTSSGLADVPQSGTDHDNYFTDLGALNQLSVLARQMNVDVTNLKEHKYMAHQLAVLYQLINCTKSSVFSEYKKSIEENFKSVKETLAATSSYSSIPCMTPQQQEWVLNLTNSIVGTINSFPVDITRSMGQVGSVLWKS